MICSVDGCTRPEYARTWCNTHYVRWQKHGDVTVDLRQKKRGEAVRFWALVEKSDNCWTWIGSRNVSGYGKFWTDEGRTVRPHRWSYEQAIGPIPAELQLDHLCRNRACVRPDHLEAVTGKINTGRSPRAKATHCKHGHEFNTENTYIVKPSKSLPHGGRGCMTCRNANAKRHAERMRAKTAGRPRPLKEACKHGHLFTPENTYTPPGQNVRMCRTCRRQATNDYGARQRAGG